MRNAAVRLRSAMPWATSSAPALAVIGASTAAVYWFGLVMLAPLLPHLTTPLLDLGKITSYSLEAALQFSLSLVALFALYVLGYRWCAGRMGPTSAGVILAFPLLFAALLTAAYPSTAADVFDYMMQTRVLTHYLANPLITSPAFFDADPFYPYAVWSDLPSVYGPLWTILTIIPSLLGGDDLLASILAFKATAILFYLGDAALVYAILARTAPTEKWRGVFLFAWNPLVLWETAANAHNDAAMMFFVLLGLLAMTRRHVAAGLPALALAALVKYIAALLAPLVVVQTIRQGDLRRRLLPLAAGSVGAALLVGLFYYPFWEGWYTLEALGRRSAFLTASPASLLSLGIAGITGSPPPSVIVSLVALALFALFYLREIGRPDLARQDLAASSFRIVFYYLVLACLWFQPWYLVWLIALAAVARDTFYARLSILFSFTAMASYVVFIFVWVRYPQWFGVPEIQTLAVVTIFTAPVLWWLRRATGHRPSTVPLTIGGSRLSFRGEAEESSYRPQGQQVIRRALRRARRFLGRFAPSE